jgi:DNA (cytosine-5)-methyltransferase 1
MTKIKTYVRIQNKRKQVSIDDYIMDKLRFRGYTLDSFLYKELKFINNIKLLSAKVQELSIEKLLKLPPISPYNKPLFTFIDLFAGIGGFRLPLDERNGKCLGYSEIQWDSMRVYAQNHTMEEPYLGDIRQINKIASDQKINLIVGGVPCQSWSSAGKNKGFDDARGQLWLDTMRVVKKNQPNCFLFENVQGLADPRHQQSLQHILQSFEELDYKVSHKVLSSRDFGLVQDRNRIFIVGFKDENCYTRFRWPQKITQYPSLGEVLELDYYKKQAASKSKILSQKSQGLLFPDLNETQTKTLNFSSHNNKFNDFFIFSDVRSGNTTLHSWDFLEISAIEEVICLKMISLRRRLGKKLYNKDGAPLHFEAINEEVPDAQQNDIDHLVSKGVFKKFDDGRYDFVNSKQSTGVNGLYRVYSPNAISFPTLTATGSPDMIATIPFQGETLAEYKAYFIKEIYKKKKLRPLTEREIAQLQGFPKDFTLCEEGFSNKQMGNAVSVPVIDALFRSICDTGCFSETSL